ncbi:MAG: amidohydrolase [Chloroflexi bacterium]|nr:amidohydrolase [Chloroflexota bacterium]
MARNGHPVADCDMHVIEPPDLWQRYMEPAYKHAAPIGFAESPRDLRIRIKWQILPHSGATRFVDRQPLAWHKQREDLYESAIKRRWDPASQLAAMETEGLDYALLFPTRGLFALSVDSQQAIGRDGLKPDEAAAIARAYNNWMADFVKADPKRLLGCGMIAPHDVPSAAAEARRCVQELGFRGVFLAPGCVNRTPWDSRHYDPLWAELQRLNVPVLFHGGGRTCLQSDFSFDIFDNLMQHHTLSQPVGLMTVAVSLTSGGVFERFPKLRAGLLEGSCSWAQWLFHRLDEHYEWLHESAPDLTMKPSAYFRRNCFLAVDADELPVKQYIEWFGDDNLVFSTDYPHGDSKYPHAIDSLFKLPIPEASKRKIVWDNWCKLYDMPPGRP